MKKGFSLPKVLLVTAIACGTSCKNPPDNAPDAAYLCDGGINDSGIPDCSCQCDGDCPGSCDYFQPFADAGGVCECLV
jgi:hypothetical protein